MALKYRFNLKDIKLADFKVYLLALFKGILPKKKLKILKISKNLSKKDQPGSLKLLYITI
tara:strand:- start:406 stop:585 length:180 start_codon:yes stop_codon:yes gene_type:complete